jgi:hypothetical protein
MGSHFAFCETEFPNWPRVKELLFANAVVYLLTLLGNQNQFATECTCGV